MMKQLYQYDDLAYTPLLLIKEVSRCLLCHDAPCSKACPAQTDPAKFIRSALFRNFKGAAETIRENNVLGGICARVCPTEKLCQQGCSRSGIDTPIEIGKIQRFITDYEDASGMKILQPGSKDQGRVAIIGSGPAGLQASATLSNLGYDVTIYERNAQPGGWLRNGIPPYRLSNDLVDKEIDRIKDIGVTFICNTEIGKDISLEQLKQDNRAILLAVGASYGAMLADFADNPLVETAVAFLARAKSTNGQMDIPNSAIIIGGGDVAMDVATTLKISGCGSVTCVARESLDEFPASKKEFSQALAMNVSIVDGFTPVSVNAGEVVFEHLKLKGRLSLRADKIILAVGQKAKLDGFDTVNHQRGIVDTNKYQTSDAQVFAAGDIVQGDKTVVYAVKSGKEAAQSLHHYLGGGRHAN